MSQSKLRILVLGYIVRRPLGGGTWPSLQYALGLQRLGHDVWFIEDSEDWGGCYDPSRHITDEDPTFGLAYAKEVFARVGFERWAYYDAHKQAWHGPAANGIEEVCRSADVLINNSGMNPIRWWLGEIPTRVFIDTDPAFEQVRQITESYRRRRTAQHNVFFSLGENIAAGTADVPDDDLPWQATRQPVVLEQWPVTPAPENGPLTTVMLWDSYEPQVYDRFSFGMKSSTFEPYLDLPRGRDETLELAIGGPNAPRKMLAKRGWRIADPMIEARDPWAYQSYIQRSRGEFTVAKHGYVVSNCGWFSERSAHYLASGRPVITQDTGFRAWLPTDAGLLSFSDLDSARACLDELASNYGKHCEAARAVAEQYFDSDKVLTRLLELALASTSRSEPGAR